MKIYPNDNVGKASYLLETGILAPGKTILEVGAGNDKVWRLFSKKGLTIRSTDLVPNKNISKLDIEKDTIRAHYDIILGFGVLHHLHAPLSTFRRLQKQADCLIFVEPYRWSPIHILEAFQPREWSRWNFFRCYFPGTIIHFRGITLPIRMPQLLIVWIKGTGYQTR